MLTQRYTFFTEDEYLRLEERSDVRHEFVDGEVFAMTGASLRHNAIAINLVAAMRAHLKGGPCRVYMSDVRVHVARRNAYYYPDLLVNCGPEGRRLDPEVRWVDDARLIVEVLSSSTAGTDRREKLLAYRTLPSLQEYMLVSQSVARVEIHRREGTGWQRLAFAAFEPVELASIGLCMEMRDIYDGVSVETQVREPEASFES